jgi:Family of unknown function (DUF5994)
MMSAPRVVTILAPDRPPRAPRLMLKPEIGPRVASTGHVDGAWWPRSRDLAAELPVLAKALAAWLGRVERVSYNLAVWGDTVRRTQVDGVPVRLAGYRSQDPDTVDVLGHSHRITLLVVPPEATEVAGHQAMVLAADPTDTGSPTQLLVAAGVSAAAPIPEARAATDDAEGRWEAEGGQVRERI